LGVELATVQEMPVGSIMNRAMMNDRIGLSTICREAYSTYYSPALSLSLRIAVPA